MKRRGVLQLVSAMLALPGWAFAQTSKIYRLGWLSTYDEATNKLYFESFLVGMRERGYVVGKNLLVDVRYSRGDAARLPALADELIALKPHVLAGIESTCRVMAARTKTIPIVLLTSVDPVAAGLVKSLSRPGTNVTGMSSQLDLTITKQIELLTEIMPGMSRLGLLSDATYAGREAYEQAAGTVARAKGVTLVIASARDAKSAGQAVADLKKERADAIAVSTTGPIFFWRRAIIEAATRLRVPTSYGGGQFAESGGLFSYGTNFVENYRVEVSDFVDRIFKGANPAELPVRQTSKFELIVNLKTAREIGLTIPQSVLLRADRLIE